MKHSEETKKKISYSKKGKPSWRKGISLKIMDHKYCISCGTTFHKNIKKSEKEWNSRKYCSQKCCLIKSHKNRKGKKLSKEWCENLSKSHMGQKSWNSGKRTILTCLECQKKFTKLNRKVKGVKYCSLKCFNKTANKLPRLLVRGENHHNWKNNATSEQEKIRKSSEYKKWRHEVFERDNYTCQHCNKRGGKLNADHIMPFSLYPELRLVIDNGRTLCVECHNLIGWNLFKINNPRKKIS